MPFHPCVGVSVVIPPSSLVPVRMVMHFGAMCSFFSDLNALAHEVKFELLLRLSSFTLGLLFAPPPRCYRSLLFCFPSLSEANNERCRQRLFSRRRMVDRVLSSRLRMGSPFSLGRVRVLGLPVAPRGTLPFRLPVLNEAQDMLGPTSPNSIPHFGIFRATSVKLSFSNVPWSPDFPPPP